MEQPKLERVWDKAGKICFRNQKNEFFYPEPYREGHEPWNQEPEDFNEWKEQRFADWKKYVNTKFGGDYRKAREHSCQQIAKLREKFFGEEKPKTKEEVQKEIDNKLLEDLL